MLGISGHVTSRFSSSSTYPPMCPVSLSTVYVPRAKTSAALPCLETAEINPRGEVMVRRAADFNRLILVYTSEVYTNILFQVLSESQSDL